MLSEALGRAARDGTIWKKTTPEKRERPKRLVLKPWRLVALALVREKCQGGSSFTRLKEPKVNIPAEGCFFLAQVLSMCHKVL